ncbi:unnamed protein product [Dovyalis caffra]|uniref:VWA-Hint protein Vwaint domain-containing protein n=1 Tax=Dovyalis caffra TaxID=77055 RepID=A0AAV1RGW7_9ROSI|nr:unnamed protein product [Dovyalis caffra]
MSPSFQRIGSVHAHVPLYNAPPVHIEPEHFSDDEASPGCFSRSIPFVSTPCYNCEDFSRVSSLFRFESFSKFGVLVHVLAPPLDDTLPYHRAPIDIVIVLDVGGSMASKSILRSVLILPLRRMSESGREDATSVIDSLSQLVELILLRDSRKGLGERMETGELYERSGRAYVLSRMSSHSWKRAAIRGHSMSISSGGNSDMSTTTSYETPSMTEHGIEVPNSNFAHVE